MARSLADGSSAARQRAAFRRRGRLADVVDDLIRVTDPDHAPSAWPARLPSGPVRLPVYAREGDEVFGAPSLDDPVYSRMASVLESLGPVELRARERHRDEEQRSKGVTFGVGGRASGRLAPFDLVPRVIPAVDWSFLTEGLTQRVRALNAFLGDVYGERAAVADGVLPEEVVTAAPGLSGIGALVRNEHRAVVAGMDLVRDAQGRWFVLEDNLRVPSGLGYAVQNRRLSDAVMPDLARPEHLLDVEGVPAMLLAALRQAAPPAAGADPSVALLSEGPDGGAWFEHCMLAREMGVPLALCSDLLFEDGAVWIVQGGGRKAVDVLYLRMDEEQFLHATGADGRPLAPGLLTALHRGTLALANAPGNGVGDDKAVYAFVPAMIEYYLAEKPLLDSVPTFLCGVPEQLAEVLGRFDELVLKPVDGYGGQGVLIGPLATDEELAATRRQVRSAPHRWIAQDLVQLSTHPVFDGDALVPRHVDLRAFAFTGDEVRVAPAALTRVAPADSMVVNSSRGGGSKDTWIVGR